MVVSQRGSASGEYAPAFTKGVYEGAAVFDCDFGALVYPKWIKVVSGTEVLKASMNSNSSNSSSDELTFYFYDGTVFEKPYKKGMTWRDWIDSEFNTDSWRIEEELYGEENIIVLQVREGQYVEIFDVLADDNNLYVRADDLISSSTYKVTQMY